MNHPSTWLRRGLVALSLTTLGYACDGAGQSEQDNICEPGANVFCRCPSGEPGTMECLDGQLFGECVVGFETPCPTRDATGTGGGTGGSTAEACEPGERIFCTCAGQTGTRTCAGDGSAFGECVCDAPSSGAGGQGSGGAPPTTDLPLYSPCSSPSDCESGLCEMGYCTKTCVDIFDCTIGVAECVALNGDTHCRPTCSQQLDCGPYQLPSECGYTTAIDDFPVTVCADWFNLLQLPPIDYTCAVDVDCNLGHPGSERVCDANDNTCEVGCHLDVDCPAAETCSGISEPGVCGP